MSLDPAKSDMWSKDGDKWTLEQLKGKNTGFFQTVNRLLPRKLKEVRGNNQGVVAKAFCKNSNLARFATEPVSTPHH
jgi:hypothetical protein